MGRENNPNVFVSFPKCKCEVQKGGAKMRWYDRTLKTKELPDRCDEARKIMPGLSECMRKSYCAEQVRYGFSMNYCARELAREHIQADKPEEGSE